jgi:4-hydroxybenzoate polyprenyltransferase
MEAVYTGAQMDSSRTSHIADAAPDNWVERLLPTAALPYAQLMRLERPVGWWLLLLPCLWGLALGQLANGGGLPNLGFALLFLIGAVVMRGAGCVLNDMADKDFDARVTRTMNRPIASGRVSRSQAFIFLCVLSFAGLLVLIQFNTFTIWLGIASLAIVAVYPLMKRITYWPQAVLGLSFNWGALVGWSAVHGSLSSAPVFLYAAGVLWTLAYDTIYAHQDRDDDLLIGVKSTALLFGAKTKPWLALFFAGFVACVAAALYQVQVGLAAWIGLVAAGLHGLWQVHHFSHDDGAGCLKLFKSNRTLGLMFLAGLIVDGLAHGG